MIKGLIFDYGGTLDTGGCHWGKVLWHAYQRHQVPVSEQQFRDAYVYAERALGKNPIIQSDYTFHRMLHTKVTIEMEYLVSQGFLQDHSLLDAVVDDLYRATIDETHRSIEVLRKLSVHYPMVLVSNFYGNINVVLQEFGFEHIFKQVVESAVVGIRKPDARIFGLGVEALGLKANEVIVVGDSMSKDIIPARSIGCRTIWFKGEGWTDSPEDETVPDYIITNIEDILILNLNN